MATSDVPGAKPENRDVLAMGCWAEHQDGSLIFVESTEGGKVVYSLFDTTKDPVLEYRGAMPGDVFKKQFSHPPTGTSTELWTWHDKTPFPWDRIMDDVQEGVRVASADGLQSAASRVAEDLKRRGEEIKKRRFSAGNVSHLSATLRKRLEPIADKLGRAFNELRS